MNVYYCIYERETGNIVGHGCTDPEAVEIHKEHLRPEWALKELTMEEYQRVSVCSDIFNRLFYVDGDGTVKRKQEVSISADKHSFRADGVDVVTVTTDAPEPVEWWISGGKIEGKHSQLELVSRLAKSFTIFVDDPRYHSAPIEIVARREV